MPALNVEACLHAFVIRHAHVVAREDARLAAVSIPSSKAWSARCRARCEAGRNQVSIPCCDERAKRWVFIHVLEQAHAVIPNIANFTDDPAAKLALHSQIPLLRIGIM